MAERFELKYLISAEQAHALLRDLALHLPPRAPGPALGSGAAYPAPSEPEQHIVTTYLDSPGHDIYRACLAGAADEKVRIKEYWSQAAPERAPAVVWLELKKSSESRTHKGRMAVPRRVMERALAAGCISVDALAATTAPGDRGSHELLQRLRSIAQRHHQPLMPSWVVCYRRSAWQDAQLRVTVDQGLRARRPWAADADSVRLLPEGAGRDTRILEIKYGSQLPDWLAAHLARLAPARLPHTERPFSKFLAASLAMQGEALPARLARAAE